MGYVSFDEARDSFYENSGGSGQYRYCNNEKYSYTYDANFNYTDIGCAYSQAEETAVKGESQMFYSTMLQSKTAGDHRARALRTLACRTVCVSRRLSRLSRLISSLHWYRKAPLSHYHIHIVYWYTTFTRRQCFKGASHHRCLAVYTAHLRACVPQ